VSAVDAPSFSILGGAAGVNREDFNGNSPVSAVDAPSFSILGGAAAFNREDFNGNSHATTSARGIMGHFVGLLIFLGFLDNFVG
jgi:hypothetical protein